MSTKNLSHTVIEGGRSRFNVFFRRHSNRIARRRTREYCDLFSRTATSPEARSAGEDLVTPMRRPVYRCFEDKLAPARRFLESRVGRNWDKVYSELRRTFDTRTTAGRHIVFDHMLPWVEGAGLNTRFPLFFIDSQRRLQKLERRRFSLHFYKLREPLPEPIELLEAWISNRAVAAVGTHFFWFEPTPSGAFRQGSALDAAEQARFRRLPHWFQEQLTPLARQRTANSNRK